MPLARTDSRPAGKLNMQFSDILQEFSILLAVIDPFGAIPIFLALAASIPQERRARVAVRAVLVSGAILIFFIVLGQIFLEAAGVSMTSFQLAGSVVLFLFGLKMIFDDDSFAPSEGSKPKTDMQLAVYPLAIPGIAGPGGILAVVLLTDNRSTPLLEQAITTGLLIAVLLITLACLLLATRIHRLIGDAGSSILSRVMGLVLAALAIEMGLDALSVRFGI